MRKQNWYQCIFFIIIVFNCGVSIGSQGPAFEKDETRQNVPATINSVIREENNSSDEEAPFNQDEGTTNYGSGSDHERRSTTRLETDDEPPLFDRIPIRGSIDNKAPWNKFIAGELQKNTQYKQNPAYNENNVFKSLKKLEIDFLNSINNVSTSQRVGQIVAAFFGVGPSQVDIPLVNVTLTRIFNWPPEATPTWVIGSAITVFTTPIYMKQLSEVGKNTATLVFGPKSPMEKYRNKPTIGHQFFRWGIVSVAAAVPTALEMAFYFSIEQQTGDWSDVLYAAVTVGPAAIARFLRRVETAQWPIDHVFFRSYDPNSITKQKEVVQCSIELCKKKSRIDKIFRNKLFDVLKEINYPEDMLRLGVPCLTHVIKMPPTLEFNLDLYNVSPESPLQSFLPRTASVIQGAAFYSNYFAVKYSMQHLLLKDQSTLSIAASETTAILSSLAQIIVDKKITTSWLSSWGGGLFTWPSVYPWATKLTRCANFINSCLHAVPMLYLAKEGITEQGNASPVSTACFLTPFALSQLVHYDSYFEDYTKRLISDAALFRMRNPSENQKKVYIDMFCDMLELEIKKMNPDNFLNFYHAAFRN